LAVLWNDSNGDVDFPIGDDELPRLEAVARAHHPRPEKLIAASVRYLAPGGLPVILDGEVTSDDLARIAMSGESFDWLADEPDLYTESDGVPYTV
jgi:hypothetical protein